eukprot:TRINITY_DN2836_c0_g1_i2.p1 TRINITY_DN2836_c0_g1~~TRINITY_DN2836_c0_g1_i2.p1  ORF type:complete len:150 (+),score=24.44 TRINITY_DN2836_c0_g1_i2:324-773(+)
MFSLKSNGTTIIKRILTTKILFKSYSTSSNVTVTRNDKYSQVTEEDISYFKSILEEGGVITDKDDLRMYNTDWMNKYKGNSKVALRPKTTEQISAILKHCHSRSLAVVPQGGNTGLVGGSVPVFDEVILSLGLMNKVSFFKIFFFDFFY